MGFQKEYCILGIPSHDVALCRTDWPQTHIDLFSSTSGVLGLSVYVIVSRKTGYF